MRSGLSGGAASLAHRANEEQIITVAMGRDAHAVIDHAKDAGVYVLDGGLDEVIPPVRVSADGVVTDGGCPWAPRIDGGLTKLEVPSLEEAIAWAARIAKACLATAAPECPPGLFLGSGRLPAQQLWRGDRSFATTDADLRDVQWRDPR
jgi:hypothetical protein